MIIINRNGGLVFNKKLSALAPDKGVNDMMVIGSTLHSLFEIIKQIAPTPSGGIESLETSTFKLCCFQTFTGVKFVVTSTSASKIEELEALCNMTYELYSDYTLKNPFYEIEQPINCSLFTTEVNKTVLTKSYLSRVKR